MRSTCAKQASLFPSETAVFPSTRYQGSKAKLADWIWSNIRELSFDSCLDAFGGTGAVSYRLKKAGKSVVYNDLLRFNHIIGTALVENSRVRLDDGDVEDVLRRSSDVSYPDFVERTFRDVYFTDEENRWVDQAVTNISRITDRYKRSIAMFALFQACIIKRPYNLFHRKNLYVRFADVERSFGNKKTWDTPFDHWFRTFVGEANGAVFDNGRANSAVNMDAVSVPGDFDLVYIDPPYVSGRGVGVDYRGFYHFLEGLTMYDEWEAHIDTQSKHLRLQRERSRWCSSSQIHGAFDELFKRFRESTLVVSYRSDGVPSEAELTEILGGYKRDVRSVHYGEYQYVLSKNRSSREVLLVGT